MVTDRRILSIDGGGIKGVFPAAFLADLEEHLSEPLFRYFDLIVGTSTGGIIALGLALGLSAAEILQFYRDYGPDIFKGNRLLLTLKQLAYRKFSHRKLEAALIATFGERRIGDAQTRVLVTSMNIDTGGVHLFKTAHHERFERDYKVSAVEAALATSSAPTYFPVLRRSHDVPLVDGGLWANNPIAVGVTEAIGVLNWPRSDIRVLSVGCTEELFDVGIRARRHIGILWGLSPTMAKVFMQGQTAGAMGMVYTLLGHDRVVRIGETVKSGRFALDSSKRINELIALGANRARHESSMLKQTFFNEPIQPFVPFRR